MRAADPQKRGGELVSAAGGAGANVYHLPRTSTRHQDGGPTNNQRLLVVGLACVRPKRAQRTIYFKISNLKP